jgi:hypothetical protein
MLFFIKFEWRILLIFCVIATIATGCLEEKQDEPKLKELDSSLQHLKLFFEENKQSFFVTPKHLNLRSESQEMILPFFEKEPDWTEFHHYFFEDGREVYEINLKNAEKYYPSGLSDSLSKPYESVIQNLLFIKNEITGKFDPLIALYYPSNDSALREFDDISYNTVDFEWSGTIDIWTFDERHYIGFNISEGQIQSYFSYGNFPSIKNGRKSASGFNYDVVDCVRIPTYVSYSYITTQSSPGQYSTTLIATQNYANICTPKGGTELPNYFEYTTYSSENYLPNVGGTSTTGYIPPYIEPPSFNPYVVLPPVDIAAKINDIKLYLKCFNKSNSAKVTIYADQPIPNTRATYSSNWGTVDVGHSFISIEQIVNGNKIVRTLGFYPSTAVRPGVNPSAPSILIDDSGHTYDVSIDKEINASQLSQIINFVENYEKMYHLGRYNCTNFALQVASFAGLNIPKTIGEWPFGSGCNPGDFGEDLKNISGAIPLTGASAKSNIGNC